MTKLTVEEMQKIAEERGGVCLSKEYINNMTHLLWECKDGHKWKATPNHIKRGRWCPNCGGSEKLTIKEMQKIAKERGGGIAYKKINGGVIATLPFFVHFEMAQIYSQIN